MAAVQVLVDTHILIDYFNAGDHSKLLDGRGNRVYYSIVTQKELLAKRGLSAAERRAIRIALGRFRLVPLSRAVTEGYSVLRRQYPSLEKENALVAATASSSGFHS